MIIRDFDRPVSVYGYDLSLGAKSYHTVSAVIGYTYPQSGRTFHLILHQAIEIPDLDHHQLCPVQCRVNDVIVNDTPNFCTRAPTRETHAIIAPDPDGNPPLIMPLHI